MGRKRKDDLLSDQIGGPQGGYPQGETPNHFDSLLLETLPDDDGADDFCVTYDSDMDLGISDEIQREESKDVKKPSAIEKYYLDIRVFPLLTKEEEIALSMRAEQGDTRAKNRMVESNLRLVCFIARRYLYRGVDFEDLVQEGNLGLISAVDRYDYRKGYRFSTYAFYWIKKAIIKALAEQGHLVTLPVTAASEIAQIKKAIDNYTAENGYDPPTVPQLSKITGINQDRIRELMVAGTTPMSIQAPVKKKEGTAIQDIIPDTSNEDIDDYLMRQDTAEKVQQAMRKLPDRERHIMELRFGIVDGNARNLEEIGHEFGVTRERIRMIEKRCLEKLRNGSSRRELASLLADL